MLLTATNVSKSFVSDEGLLTVLNDVSLSLDAGESLALTGESGSGKSTLLHLIGGLDQPNAGNILIDGVQIVGLRDRELARVRREKVGLIFQQFNLIPSLTVAQNLAFHARLAQREDTAWTSEIADRLGLEAYLKRYPEQLSGGQQQRVAIGRTLAAHPALVLADEPTGNLDEGTADEVMTLMLDLVQAAGASLLMVTHSMTRAKALGRHLHLAKGQIA